jgi:hypothetical protein
MTIQTVTAARIPGRASDRTCTHAARVTKSLLGYGVLAAFAGVTTGSSASAIVVPFYAAVLLAWAWIAVTCVHLYRCTEPSSEAGGR